VRVADERDHRDAAELARRAGELLVELRAGDGRDGRALGAEGDRRSQALLARLLAERHPGDAVLSEETVDRPDTRLGAARVWIIDPLDGTREYGEPPRDDWAVHVALWERTGAPGGSPPAGDARGTPGATGAITAAAVALPARDRLLATPTPLGHSTLLPLPRPAGARRLTVSRTRPPVETEAVAAAVGAEVVPMGSAGAKTMAVLLGEVDAYVHSGGQHEWDVAAPAGVAAAAGLWVSRLDGSPLRFNQPDPVSPDLVVCHPDLAPAIIAAAAAVHG
jgi:3'(2'), 5'-bisphosphate nucleotidase